MIVSAHRILLVFTACAAMLGFAGCSRSFTAREYPAFYDPNLRTVAVVPFQNETNAHDAGMLAAENLAASLRVNGTYAVVSPRKLRSLMAQKKLEGLSRKDYQKDAELFRKLGGVQAFVVGKVLRESSVGSPYFAKDEYGLSYYPTNDTTGQKAHYQLAHEEEGVDEGPDQGEFADDLGDDYFSDFYGPYYPYWYWNYPYYYPEYAAKARVSLEATMVRVSDGEVLYTTSAPVQGYARLSGYHLVPPASATLDAMNRATAKLVKDMAVIPVKVKISTHVDLKTAVPTPSGAWAYENKFSPAEPTMYVVVQLPPKVSHDTFRLTITPRGQPDEVLVAKDFTWPPDKTVDTVAFSPKEIAERAGPGGYAVRFNAWGESVMSHNFTIK